MVKSKKQDLINLSLTILLVVLLNYVGSSLFYRYDLTTENRYTLSDTSRDLLEGLDDIVYVKVYLEGEFPSGFQRLRNETKEILNEFIAYAGDNVQYEFINPSLDTDKETLNSTYKQLSKKGLLPTDLNVKKQDGTSSQIIWPGAILNYKGRDIALNLLKSQMGVPAEVMLNNSVESLEYEFMAAIDQLLNTEPKRIAFIEGHGEFSRLETAGLGNMLSNNYIVERVSLSENLDALTERSIIDSTSSFHVIPKFDVILIAGSKETFSEKDKFIIDQYIMYGGKVVWLIDQVAITMDSLRTTSTTTAVDNELNLADQLFKYGVRINNNLLLDIQAAPIPIVTGMLGNQPKTELMPWYFFPLLRPANNHPIVNHLNTVKSEFVSSIDTVGGGAIKKTPLLVTSNNTKISNTPSRVSLSMMRHQPNMSQYTAGSKMTAVLLEGTFESIFANRIVPTITQSKEINYKENSLPTQMVVVADADVTRNQVNTRKEQYFQLGFDRFSKQQFGNLDFMLNVVNYLCDDNGLMEVRSKRLTIRLLDKLKIKEEKQYWQIINISLPIIIIIFLGLGIFLYRRRLYK